MIQFTDQEFQTIKEKGEKFYQSIGEIYCPYFKEKILFGDKGLVHLKFKRLDKARPLQDQYMRFKILHFGPEIVRLSHTLQGLSETKHFEKVRVHNRTETILKPVIYYEFVAILNRNRIKVIIKQIDSGPKFFWSIIPFWRTNKETLNRILHDGTPEEN